MAPRYGTTEVVPFDEQKYCYCRPKGRRAL